MPITIIIDLDKTIRNPKNGQPLQWASDALQRYDDFEKYSKYGSVFCGIGEGFEPLESCIKKQQQTLLHFPKLDQIFFNMDSETAYIVSRTNVSKL